MGTIPPDRPVRTVTLMGPEGKGSMVSFSKQGSMVSFSKQGSMRRLSLSDDFRVPATPAYHWQIVDSMGNTMRTRRLVTMGDKFHETHDVSATVKDVAKVHIYRAYAETVLGEAAFEKPMM